VQIAFIGSGAVGGGTLYFQCNVAEHVDPEQDQDLGGVASRRSGLGTSHQTGWTRIVSLLIEIFFGKLDAQTFLQGGRGATLGERRKGCSSRRSKWD
jgi:hypothetical protein